MEVKTVYFEKPGIENTDAVFELVKQRAKDLGINTVLVASTTGATGVRAVDAFQGMKVIIITHSMGTRRPNFQELTEENRKMIESKGGIIHTATHALSGIDRAFHQDTGPDIPAPYVPHYVPGDLITSTLKIFGQGMKVTCEIAAMAADAGLVRTDEEVISIAGTGAGGRGADTAIVLQPSNSFHFFAMRIKELICKPRL